MSKEPRPEDTGLMAFPENGPTVATRFRQSGEDLIVFIHGLGCVKESFDGAYEAPDLANHSLFSFDWVGFGESAKPQDFSYDLEDQADIVHGMLTTFPADRLHIVAHSLGGIIGILLASRLRDQVETLICVEASLSEEGEGSIRRSASGVTFEEFRDITLPTLRAKYTSAPEASSRQWAQWSEAADPLAFYNSARSATDLLAREQILKTFLNLSCNKFYLYGDMSHEAKRSTIQKLEPTPTVAIPDSGHFAMTDNPIGFYEQLPSLLATGTPR